VEYPISELSNTKFVNKLKYIGEINLKPKFVKSISNKNKKIIEICYIQIKE